MTEIEIALERFADQVAAVEREALEINSCR